jgi:hypothetical protein
VVKYHCGSNVLDPSNGSGNQEWIGCRQLRVLVGSSDHRLDELPSRSSTCIIRNLASSPLSLPTNTRFGLKNGACRDLASIHPAWRPNLSIRRRRRTGWLR